MTNQITRLFARLALLSLPTLLGLQLSVNADTSEPIHFGLSKVQFFVQDDASQPAPDTENGFMFVASFDIEDPNSTASGTLTLPDGKIHTFTSIPNSNNFYHVVVFETEAELHAEYPFGTYTFSINIDGEVFTGPIALTSTPFPGAPHVVNYDDLQEVDPNEAFTVEWAPFPGGTAADFIFLDELGDYRSPEPWEPGVLTGADTSIVIEEGTVEAGSSYEANLYFAKVVDRNETSIPGALGAGIVGTLTRFNVTTTGAGNGDFAITTSSLPNAVLGEPYSVSLEASEPVFIWLVDDEENLPDGITLDSTSGELAGTPTEAGSFQMTIMAYSQTFAISFKDFTLTVTTGEALPVVPEAGQPTFEGGIFSLMIQSPGGNAVQVEISNNLRDWTVLDVLTPIDGRIEFQDTPEANETARFYRLSWGP